MRLFDGMTKRPRRKSSNGCCWPSAVGASHRPWT